MSYKNFSYWFDERIVDNNDISVTDINKGLTKLIPDLIDELNNLDNAHQTFVVNEQNIGEPDAQAYLIYGNPVLWWYICLSNLIDDPFEEFTSNKIFYAFDEKYLSEHNVETESQTTTTATTGTTITLN